MASTKTALTSGVRRAALVTGSQRGIGRAIAIELARAGMDVCVNCASESSIAPAHELAAELEGSFGIRAIACSADVSSASDARFLVDAAHEAFGRLDVLVNNAGITRDGLIARMSEEDFDSVLAVNLKGVFNCSKAAAKIMMKQRSGRIISLSSVSGVCGNAGQVNYAASKAGVIGLTKALAKELAPRNITVNAVAPGFIETDMTAGLSEAQRAAALERIALGRLGKPSDVACVCAFLASDAASYITGQVVRVDGGLTL